MIRRQREDLASKCDHRRYTLACMGSGLMTRMSALSPAMAVNTGCFEAIGFASLPYFRNPYPNPAVILPKPMKPLGHLIVSSIGLAASAVSLSAQSTLYWDGTDTTADANGGGGTWDSGIASNWDLAATAGSASVWPGTSSGADHTVFGGVAGTVTIAAGGVTTNDITFSTAGYTISGGPLTLDGTTPTITNGGSASILSNISGTAGLTKSGNGTLTLGGNNSGLSGALVIRDATSGNNGGVVISGSNAMGAISSVDIQNNSFLRLDIATVASTVAITVAGGGGTSAPEGAIRGNSGNSVVNASIAIGNGSVPVGNTGTSTTFNGAITAASSSGFGLLIRKANGVGAIFTNASNYWEGVTQLHDGSHYFHPGAMPSASNLQLAASTNAWFESNGSFTRAVGTAAGQVQCNAGAGRINGFSARGGNLTVNLGGAGDTLTWGSGGFVPNILGLAGNNATGTLTWENPIDLAAANRTINVANGTADVDARMSGDLTNGGILKTGPGVLALSGTNAFTTATLEFHSTAGANNGSIRLETDDALSGVTLIKASPSSGNSIGTGSSRALIELVNDVTINGIRYDAAGRSAAATDGAAIASLSGDNIWGGEIRIMNTGGSYGIRCDDGSLTLNGRLGNGISSARVWDLVCQGDIFLAGNVQNVGSGTLGLIKTGAGRLVLTGSSNTYSGGTTVSEGTLEIGNGGTTGSPGSGALANAATVVIDRDGTLAFDGPTSGEGEWINRGPGVVTMGGTLAHTGPVTVENGSLLINGDGSAATGTVTVGDGVGAAGSAVLGGGGAVGGPVLLDSDGAINPGTTVGILDLVDDVSGSGGLRVDVDGANADLLIVGGTLDISSMDLSIQTLGAPTEAAYVIVDAQSPITGASFATVSGVPSGYVVEYGYDDGIDTHNIAIVSTGGTPFTTWASANGLAGGDAGAETDPDGDGLENAIEFVIGGQPNPANPGAASNHLAPTVDEDASNLIFRFRRTDLSLTEPGIAIAVQYGSDLDGWTTAVDGVNSISVAVSDDFHGAGTDQVEVTIPQSLAAGELEHRSQSPGQGGIRLRGRRGTPVAHDGGSFRGSVLERVDHL